MKLLSAHLLLICLAFAFESCGDEFDNWEPPARYQTTKSNDGEPTAFLSARTWGLVGNHEETRVCSDSFVIGKEDPQNHCLILYSNEIFYKWDAPQKLRIYVYSHAIPRDHSEEIGGIKLALMPREKTEDIESTFNKRGLTRFAA